METSKKKKTRVHRRRGNTYKLTVSEYNEMETFLKSRKIRKVIVEKYLDLPSGSLSKCTVSNVLSSDQLQRLRSLCSGEDSNAIYDIHCLIDHQAQQTSENHSSRCIELDEHDFERIRWLVDRFGVSSNIPDIGISPSTYSRILRGNQKRIKEAILVKILNLYDAERAKDADRRYQSTYNFEKGDGSTIIPPQPPETTAEDVNHVDDQPVTDFQNTAQGTPVSAHGYISKSGDFFSNQQSADKANLIESQPKPNEDLEDIFQKSLGVGEPPVKGGIQRNEGCLWNPSTFEEAITVLKMKMDAVDEKTLKCLIKDIADNFCKEEEN